MKTTLTAKTAALAAALLLGAAAAQAQFSLLHSFSGGASDGESPYGSLTLSGSTLYGMARYGGGGGIDPYEGMVFSMNTDGTGFSLLHSFAGGDGRQPHGNLTLSGSTLYGMTAGGGASGRGTIFQMNTDGTGFSLLRSFAGGASDGEAPYGSLTLSGSTFYGMTRYGGDSDRGTIFQMNTNGTGFNLLHEFVGGVSDGQYPIGSLTLSGTKLYGMTEHGGIGAAPGNGVVFSMDTDGTDFTVLHAFASGIDGELPGGSLTLDGATLYGMTSGNNSGIGTLFQINTDGTGYSVLHTFAGNYPQGSLTLDGATLYGMTSIGGTGNRGSVFQINTDGTGFTERYSLAGDGSQGDSSHGDLTLSGLTVYGMTSVNGPGGYGTVFSLEVPEPSTCALLGIGLLGLAARRWRRRRRKASS